MKKRIVSFTAVLLLSAALTACGADGIQDKTSDQTNRTESGDMTAEHTEDGGAATDPGKNGDAGADRTENGDLAMPSGEDDGTGADSTEPNDAATDSGENGGSTEPAVQAGVPLTEDELSFFSDFIQKMGNYGFLLSEYDTPEQVNLDEVFYSGAGIASEMSQEEVEAYLAYTGQDEIYTDCIRISRENADAFLLEKLGIGLDEIPDGFPWIYLSEFDSYYHEAGDTNYMEHLCIDGTRSGDIYTLHFRSNDRWGTFQNDYETQLQKVGDEYHFVSNHLLTP